MRMRVLATLTAAGLISLLGCSASLASVPATVPTGPAPHPARQLLVVSAHAYGDTHATLTAYETSGGRRRIAFGPWAARIGYNGFAPPGRKREGDGRTPSGTYAFHFIFGIAGNPGVRYPYRRVHASMELRSRTTRRTSRGSAARSSCMWAPAARPPAAFRYRWESCSRCCGGWTRLARRGSRWGSARARPDSRQMHKIL
jgi:L,D-peptidoglycan transpeptidase YkuD (ErfK/YbiS/YcfS/YnhG family)